METPNDGMRSARLVRTALPSALGAGNGGARVAGRALVQPNYKAPGVGSKHQLGDLYVWGSLLLQDDDHPVLQQRATAPNQGMSYVSLCIGI